MVRNNYKDKTAHISADMSFDSMGVLQGILQKAVSEVVTGPENTETLLAVEEIQECLGIDLDMSCEGQLNGQPA